MAVFYAQSAPASTSVSSSPPQVEALKGTIGVVVIGGDLLFREGLKSLFSRSQFAVLGEYDGLASLDGEASAGRRPQIVLVVRSGAPLSAIGDWRQALRGLWPDAHAVVLASQQEDEVLVDALQGGADGCLYTNMSPEALVQSLRLVAMGENVFPTRIGRRLCRQPLPADRPRLTPRERDILRGLLAGHSNKMIANDLGTTDMTVKAQLRHLLRKLGVANRTQAALWAREQGLDKEVAH
jgi:two-component system nitrate/nitrite response regulator NarL